MEAGLAREFFASEGTGTIQRPIETHAFAKIDHARDQRSREVAEDVLREFLRFLDIDLMILVRHNETSPHAKILAALYAISLPTNLAICRLLTSRMQML